MKMIRNQRIWWVMMAVVSLSLVLTGCKVPPEEGRHTRVAFILNDVDLETAVGVALIADRFGWGENLVVMVMRDAHLSLEDAFVLFTILELARSEDIDFVISLRERGLGWGEVAHECGVRPDVFNRLRPRFLIPGQRERAWEWGNDGDYDDGLTIIFLSDYFGVRANLLRQEYDEGIGIPDLMLGLALGRRTGRDWGELLQERRERRESWLRMCDDMGVDLSHFDRMAEEAKQPPREEERGWKGKGKERHGRDEGGRGRGRGED
jgi:hypothetical protein